LAPVWDEKYPVVSSNTVSATETSQAALTVRFHTESKYSSCPKAPFAQLHEANLAVRPTAWHSEAHQRLISKERKSKMQGQVVG